MIRLLGSTCYMTCDVTQFLFVNLECPFFFISP